MTGPDSEQPAPTALVNPERSGHRFILSAPSGAGKTTLCRAVLDRFPAMRYSVSYTTRKPRPSEVDGIDYFFITPDEFKEKLSANRWAEWANVHGNYYGTSADFLESQSAAGHVVLLDIDVRGAKQILARYPYRTVTIFIMPPSMAVLKERLVARGAENGAEMKKRLQNAVQEIARKDLYHHVIVNDRLPDAIQALSKLISRYLRGKLPAERIPNSGRKA